jgi:hypothetical protein
MTYQTYTLTRVIDGDRSEFAQSFTTSDDDAVNCAHMLAAGFNTMSRNFLNGATLAVVYSDGRVQYDGKIETIERPKADEPWSYAQTLNLEVSPDHDGMTTIFDNENVRLIFPSSLKFHEAPEPSEYAHIAREVLESAYEELQAVKEVLADAGVETIPADAGATDLRAVLRARDIEIAELVQERANANADARVEMISFVKRAHAKKVRLQTAVPDGDGRPELDQRWRGMLDVLAKFLVITGEADADEGHAVARKLCGVEADEF